MDSKALREGYLLKNKEYRIISLLGQGGFGITYLAEQLSLSRKVAIKEFFMKENCNRDENTSEVSVPSVGSRELVDKFRQKFLREARMIAKLDNPYIVKIHDVFEENGTAYYVMEYLGNGSLQDEVKQHGAMSESKALGYFGQVADALGYLHGKNILHFDIKPANILVGNAGQATLIDFGISKHYDTGGSQTSSTPVGISKGYAPLEQYQQGEISTFTPATDIYALGATLYYLLLGQIPPSASEVNEEGLGVLPAHLSISVRKAIEKAMSPRRKDRPQSVTEFLSLLENGSPVSLSASEADEETRVEPVVKASSVSASPSEPHRKSRKVFLGVLVCCTVLTVILAAFLFMNREHALPPADVAVVDSIVQPEAAPVAQPASSSTSPSVQTGTLKVSSTPSGAAIWLDGKNTGKTTPELLEELSVGKHALTLKLSGYQDVGKSVTVASSRRAESNIVLTKILEVVQTGTLKVSSTPSGAAIWLDGKNTGKNTPEELEEVEPGKHMVVLKLSGYRESKKFVSVVSARRAECSVLLVKTPDPSRVSTPQNYTETVFGINMKMVYVEGGSFTMGATPEQGSDAYDNEKPVHEVTLSGYYIGTFEVTQGQWEKVMGSNPSYFKKGDNYPVENVNWNEAQAFCRELSRRTGKKYALPTEAQWEYAARGGNKNEGSKYSGSDAIDVVAWYASNSSSSTHPVGAKRPNALGLYDMSGNVYEWCRDWKGAYTGASQTNPTGPSSGSSRVLRGGSWYDGARFCRVSNRIHFSPAYRNRNLGFRVVCLP